MEGQARNTNAVFCRQAVMLSLLFYGLKSAGKITETYDFHLCLRMTDAMQCQVECVLLYVDVTQEALRGLDYCLTLDGPQVGSIIYSNNQHDG